MKPWGDDTDMDAMLKDVKAIEMEGLVWGACEGYFSCGLFFLTVDTFLYACLSIGKD